jgi:hypothetical protein
VFLRAAIAVPLALSFLQSSTGWMPPHDTLQASFPPLCNNAG